MQAHTFSGTSSFGSSCMAGMLSFGVFLLASLWLFALRLCMDRFAFELTQPLDPLLPLRDAGFFATGIVNIVMAGMNSGQQQFENICSHNNCNCQRAFLQGGIIHLILCTVN